MSRRGHERLETDALFARKDEQISTLDDRLHQTITHLSLVRARLLLTLNQLDALQQEHTAALASAAREQQRLEAKLRAAEEMARAGEADRMDMRDAVAMLVKRVEDTPDFRNWPRSQIQLSTHSEPLRHPSTHQPDLTYPSASPSKPHRHKHSLSSSNDANVAQSRSLTEQLAYASTLISHFRTERDTALARTEQSEARALELEARLARREALLAACSCAVTATKLSGSGGHRRRNEDYLRVGRGVNSSPPVASHRKFRSKGDPSEEGANVDDMSADILDVSLNRNRELEREVQALSRQLNRARIAQDFVSPRGAATNALRTSTHKEQRTHHSQTHIEHHAQTYADHPSPHVFTPPPRHQRLHHPNQRLATPYEDADASLLSSLSFSPSTATSQETGEATSRQHEYESHDRHDEQVQYQHAQANDLAGASDYETSSEDVFRVTADDESVTRHDEFDLKPVRRYAHGRKDSLDGDDIDDLQYEIEMNGMKAIPIPVPSLRALHRQIALLGKKIDAFAVERRRVAVDVSRRAEMGGDGNRGLSAGVVGVREGMDEDERGSRGGVVVGRSASAGESRGDEMGFRIENEEQDHRNGAESGRISRTALRVRVKGGTWSTQHDAGISNVAQTDDIDEDVQGDANNDARYMHTTASPPPNLSPLPLPLPLSLSTPLPHAQAQLTPSPPHSPSPHLTIEGQSKVYDHPHETCEATLLTARKREMQLVERVRVLEGALAVVEAQVRRQGAVDEVAVQAPSAQSAIVPRSVDVAVQTLMVLPGTSLNTLAPVGDLVGLDATELPVATEEELKVEAEDEDKGDMEAGADDGEIPMELATPLWPVSTLPEVPGVYANTDVDDDEDNSSAHEFEGGGGACGSGSDSGLAPTEEQSAGCEGQELVPADEPQRENVDILPAPAPSSTHNSPCTATLPTPHPISPPTQPSTPSPPSSTGTSPTLAVGLLPPLPLHAHLSLPASLLYHSHHASSVSSPLLPPPSPHAHSGLRRAHTDSDIGANSHARQEESAHRFVMYRATSSFVAGLRQAESRPGEMAVQDVNQRVLDRIDDSAGAVSAMPDAQVNTVKERHDTDEHSVIHVSGRTLFD